MNSINEMERWMNENIRDMSIKQNHFGRNKNEEIIRLK